VTWEPADNSGGREAVSSAEQAKGKGGQREPFSEFF